jgi:hypothetical protein
LFEKPNIRIVLDTSRFRGYFGLWLGHSLLTPLVLPISQSLPSVTNP